MSNTKNLFCYERLADELKRHFYVNVPFPLSSIQIQEAMNAFFCFLNEPEAIKHHIDFKIYKTHRRGDVGFKHRQENEGIYDDNKDFFHYHPAIIEKYADFIDANPILKTFIERAHSIWKEVYNVSRIILNAFELHHPGIINRIYHTDTPHILLRFLKYEWANSGKYLAKPHYDAGSFTLAIAESCQGLRIGSVPENLKMVDHHPQHAIFMFSSNFKKLIQTDVFQPAWHDVIQTDENKIGQPYARWALVAFIEAHDVDALPRSETHKWFVKAE